MNTSAIRTIEYQLYEYLIELRMLYGFLDADDIVSDIQNYIELVKTRRYRIAMVGMFKRGKSSLLNALLGHAILPSDIRPATATINRITFSPTEKAEVIYRSGERADIEIDELVDYVSKVGKGDINRIMSILEVVVGYPSVFCQNYIDIIDTPGLEDDETLTRLTLEQIDEIDAAIVVISALMPCSESEQELILRLIESGNIHNLVFAVSFIDCLESEEEIERVLENTKQRICEGVYSRAKDEQTLKKAHRILDNIALFGISSRDALRAFSLSDRKLLKKSRFPVFQDELYKIVTAAQTTNMIEKIRTFVRTAIMGLESRYRKRRAELQGRTSALEDSIKGLIRRREALCGQTDAALEHISDSFYRRAGELALYGDYFISIERSVSLGLARITSDEEINEKVRMLSSAVHKEMLGFANALLESCKDSFLLMFNNVARDAAGEAAPVIPEEYRERLNASLLKALSPVSADPEGGMTLCVPQAIYASTLYTDITRHFFSECVRMYSLLEARLQVGRSAFSAAIRSLDEAFLSETQLSLEAEFRRETDALNFLNLSFKQSKLKSSAILDNMASDGGI